MSKFVAVLATLLMLARPVYYSQADPKWGNIVLTCENGDTDTFARRGCGETVFAMLVSTYIDPDYTPLKALDEVYGYGYCHGTGYMRSAERLREQGFTVIQAALNIQSLKEYVKDGWLVWMHVEWKNYGHEILITGVNENNNFMISDPLFGIGAMNETIFPYNETNFAAWYVVKYNEPLPKQEYRRLNVI
jgi:hypothetical protein